LENNDIDLVYDFSKHIKQNSSMNFRRLTWEDIYWYLSNNSYSNDIVDDFYKNKVIGYDSRGNLKDAFNLK